MDCSISFTAWRGTGLLRNQCFLFASRRDDGWLSRGCVAPSGLKLAWVRAFISHFPLPSSAFVSASWSCPGKTEAIHKHPSASQDVASLCLSFPIVRMHPPGQVCCQGASPLLSCPPRSERDGWFESLIQSGFSACSLSTFWNALGTEA